MSVKVGFIGAGGIAGAHIDALSKIPEAQLTAFSDVDIQRAQTQANRFNGKAYSNYLQMLNDVNLDCVYICVPPHAHVGQEEELANRHIPFFIEKPISNALEHAINIESAVKKSGIINSVGYHWRYMSHTRQAKERLQNSTIGMVLGYWMGGMPGVDWWRMIDQSGGQLVEQTTHIVDLARYFCGEVKEVYAAMATRALGDVPNFTVTDVGSVSVKFASGAVGSFSNTCLLKGFGYTVGLHVVTPDVVVEIDGGQYREISAGRTMTLTGGNNPYFEEDRAFIEAVVSKDASGIRSNYTDAVKTLAVTLASNQSAKTGDVVDITSLLPSGL